MPDPEKVKHPVLISHRFDFVFLLLARKSISKLSSSLARSSVHRSHRFLTKTEKNLIKTQFKFKIQTC